MSIRETKKKSLSPIEAIKDLWAGNDVLGFATGKERMVRFYVSHGYPPERVTAYDPEMIAPEPPVLCSKQAAEHKWRTVASVPELKGKAGLWMAADVLTGVAYQDPNKYDPEWEFHLKPERSRDPNNPEDIRYLSEELIKRYNQEFWALWMMTWVAGFHGHEWAASMTMAVIGYFPRGIPRNVVERSIAKNPEFAFKVGPGVDLASQFKAHGDQQAKCVSCTDGEEKLLNGVLSPEKLVSLVVFRYLTQHQMGRLLMRL